MIKIVAAYSALAMLGLGIGGVWGSSDSNSEAAPKVSHTSIPTSVMTVQPTSAPVYHTATPTWTPEPTHTTKPRVTPTPTASWTPTPGPSANQTTEEPTVTPTVTETPTPSASTPAPDPDAQPTTTPSTYAPLG